MKSKSTHSRYARRSDGLHALVCKDVPPTYQRGGKQDPLPKGKSTHSVSIPPEWQAALQEMYPDLSIPKAIRKFIIENIHPVSLTEELGEIQMGMGSGKD